MWKSYPVFTGFLELLCLCQSMKIFLVKRVCEVYVQERRNAREGREWRSIIEEVDFHGVSLNLSFIIFFN